MKASLIMDINVLPSYDGCLKVIQAKILISTEDYYTCDITRTIPVRVSITTINGPVGFGIIEALDGGEESLKQYVSAMKASSSVVEIEITYQSPTVYWTRVVIQPDTPSIYETVFESSCMTRLPVIIQSGVQEHTILAPSREAFRDMLNSLKARFSRVQIKQIRSSASSVSEHNLTSKQMRAMAIAIKLGYYEIPRRTTVVAMSKHLDIGRVAMQERLRRAERAIVTDFAEASFYV
ncbi:MAG: helix-turn-helix domain-containing protein [Candidatus Thorarchaeota archaeon]